MAVAESLLASGAHVTAWDRQEEPRAILEGRAEIADPMVIDLAGYDGIVVSPGVPLNVHPIVEIAGNARVPIIGDIELFAQARDTLPRNRVIGITGTNGKSTTTALVHHILRSAGIPARMGGNIGLPIFAQAPLPAGGVYVLELSSYQIDLTRSLACDAAGLTNITPDHLDRYEGFEAYADSKARLFEMQQSRQLAAFGCADAPTNAIAHWERSRRPEGRAVCIDLEGLSAFQDEWPSLQGPHNLQNAAMAVALVEEMGVTPAQWRPALVSFRGLAHRMERLGEANGVLFINDSKATNPASAAPALAAFPPNPAKRIHWILGGLPKGDDLGECEEFFGNVAAAYTIGEAGPRFAELLEPVLPVRRCELLVEALRQAMEAAQPGEVVLFSPACASFDQFRNYEIRGDTFRQLVAALTGLDAVSQCEEGRSAA
jgi:UDP-N-acetylmuramoylalanine--D-glutamate ligase